MNNTYTALVEILRQSLAGTRYDMSRLSQLTPDSHFEAFGFDSLDMVEFFLRVQDEFQFTIKREDFSGLVSIATLQRYMELHAVGARNEASAAGAVGG